MPNPTPITAHYAVNLLDLTKFENSHATLLLRPVLSLDTVDTERAMDGAAVLVKRDTPQERWDAIVKIIREGIGLHAPIAQHELRIYKSATGKPGMSWRRI